jgi:hypothetical protein
MTTVLDPPRTTTSSSSMPSHRLRLTTAAVRIAFTWLGIRKTLTVEQKNQAAESFGAEGQFLSAGKKLLDTRHPAFKTLTGVRHRIISHWKGSTLPYPDAGIRLIRQQDLDTFNARMVELREELDEAVWRLDEHYGELQSAARDRLGQLYCSGDYPESLRGLFQVSWDFPNVEPPDYLQQLSPGVYRQECQRVAARFDEAVQMAEQSFIAELRQLVSHLQERLTGQTDGRPKIFRDSAVGNLTDFFDRFRRLNVRSNADLDDLVRQCSQTVQGVEPQTLRDSTGLRQAIATELSHVQSGLDQLLVDRPRRNILRQPRQKAG